MGMSAVGSHLCLRRVPLILARVQAFDAYVCFWLSFMPAFGSIDFSWFAGFRWVCLLLALIDVCVGFNRFWLVCRFLVGKSAFGSPFPSS